MKEELKGGKADNKTVEDIAKKHKLPTSEIEKEIKIGLSVEKEHSSTKEGQLEIAKDHIWEDPKYYSDPKTGLIKKEKESEEARKMKALAGIQEADKKFLSSDVFSEEKTPEFLESNFHTIKIQQNEVEPGEEDKILYKIK